MKARFIVLKIILHFTFYLEYPKYCADEKPNLVSVAL